MTKKPNVHVTPRPEGWAVKQAGNQRASSVHETQREAIEAGRDIARRNQSELRIHGEDNKIRDSDSYGRDPNPPKDKKY